MFDTTEVDCGVVFGKIRTIHNEDGYSPFKTKAFNTKKDLEIKLDNKF